MTVEKLVPRSRALARRSLVRGAIALSVLSIAVLAAGCGGSDDKSALPAEQVEAFASPYCVTARGWAVHELDGSADGAYARGGPAAVRKWWSEQLAYLKLGPAGAARASRSRGHGRTRLSDAPGSAVREVRLRLQADRGRGVTRGERSRRADPQGAGGTAGLRSVQGQGLRVRELAAAGTRHLHCERRFEGVLQGGGCAGERPREGRILGIRSRRVPDVRHLGRLRGRARCTGCDGSSRDRG